jgi:hypothetical protein
LAKPAWRSQLGEDGVRETASVSSGSRTTNPTSPTGPPRPLLIRGQPPHLPPAAGRPPLVRAIPECYEPTQSLLTIEAPRRKINLNLQVTLFGGA